MGVDHARAHILVGLEVLDDADVVTAFKPDYTAATARPQDQLSLWAHRGLRARSRSPQATESWRAFPYGPRRHLSGVSGSPRQGKHFTWAERRAQEATFLTDV